jgi:hypothetical protein
LTVSNAFTAQDFIEEQLSSPRSTLLKNNMLIIKKFLLLGFDKNKENLKNDYFMFKFAGSIDHCSLTKSDFSLQDASFDVEGLNSESQLSRKMKKI